MERKLTRFIGAVGTILALVSGITAYSVSRDNNQVCTMPLTSIPEREAPEEYSLPGTMLPALCVVQGFTIVIDKENLSRPMIIRFNESSFGSFGAVPEGATAASYFDNEDARRVHQQFLGSNGQPEQFDWALTFAKITTPDTK